jgi:hypothetical protein
LKREADLVEAMVVAIGVVVVMVVAIGEAVAIGEVTQEEGVGGLGQ